MQTTPVAVALASCPTYAEEEVRDSVYACLDSAIKNLSPNSKILVKPNFLRASKLACTHPLVIVSVCSWLLDNGHKPVVADSPGFGTAQKIAAFLGLDHMLKKIGVPLKEMRHPTPLPIKLANGKHEIIKISAEALEADLIFSLPKIKAHSQMGMTLAVKNCFGCVPGARKALLHTRHGDTHEEFAAWLAGLWQALPATAALCDGVICMSGTGPANGEPCHLGLIAACANLQTLDLTILDILGIPAQAVPLTKLISDKIQPPCKFQPDFPLEKPEKFYGSDFRMPEQLKPASFSLPRLLKSYCRRWLAARKSR